jgi:hypothetical protein
MVSVHLAAAATRDGTMGLVAVLARPIAPPAVTRNADSVVREELSSGLTW